MSSSPEIFGRCARATAAHLAFPLAVAIAATWFCLDGAPPIATTGPAQDAGALWLHLPCIALAVAALASALDTWPLFCRDRPGAVILARIKPRGADGCVPALLGSATALAAGLAVVAILFTWMLEAKGRSLGTVRAHVAFETQAAPPTLRAAGSLRFHASASEPIEAITIHPLGLVGGPPDAHAGLRVSSAAGPLHAEALTYHGSGERITLRFAPGRIDTLEVSSSPSSQLPLLFPAGSVEGLGAAPRSALANAVLAALSYVIPVVLGLATAALTRRHLRLPLTAVAAGSWLLIFMTVDWLPNSGAVAHHAARRWLPSENYVEMAALSLCMVAVLLLAAAFRGGRQKP